MGCGRATDRPTCLRLAGLVYRVRWKPWFPRLSKRHRTRGEGANLVEVDAVGYCSGGAEKQVRLKMVVVWCHEAGELSLNCGVQWELIFG